MRLRISTLWGAAFCAALLLAGAPMPAVASDCQMECEKCRCDMEWGTCNCENCEFTCTQT